MVQRLIFDMVSNERITHRTGMFSTGLRSTKATGVVRLVCKCVIYNYTSANSFGSVSPGTLPSKILRTIANVNLLKD